MKIPMPKIVQGDVKMRELILHVAQASDQDEKFGAQKLNKILFYADFLSYLVRGESITGQQYFALEEGPAPKRLLPIREAMKARGEIAIKKANYFGFPQERVVPLRSPDYKKLDSQDVAFVDLVIGKLRDMNGREVSEKSHDFAGWRIAWEKGPKTPIPYSIARFDLESFFGIQAPSLPASLVNHAKALHRKLFPSESLAA